MSDIQQRHFFHARLRTKDGSVAVPVTLLFQKEDAAVLCASLKQVMDDVLFILGLHADRIVPRKEDIVQANGVVADSKRTLPAGLETVYHGHIISASFELRPVDIEYAVLELPPSSSSSSSPSTTAGLGGDEDTACAQVPLAVVALVAHCRHKQSEVNRRVAKLMASGLFGQHLLADAGSGAGGGAASSSSSSSARGSGRGRGRGRGAASSGSGSASAAFGGAGTGTGGTGRSRGGRGGRGGGGGGGARSKSPALSALGGSASAGATTGGAGSFS